jgi:hypothetical protein
MKKSTLFIVLALASGLVSEGRAQEVAVSAGAGIVSSYIWRGQYCGPASVQPGIALSAGRFSVGAWGSTGFESRWREFDLYAGYSIGNFSVLVTDYFFPRNLPEGEDNGYFDYSEHVFEATVSASFGRSRPLSLLWSTNFAGDRHYSGYFEATYSIPVGGVTVALIAGVAPWKGIYSDHFAWVDAGIQASKEIALTGSFSLPLFTRATVNPDTKDVFLVFGVNF